MPAFDVVTIGAATQDVFLQSGAFEEKKDVTAPDGLDACIPLGTKVILDDIIFCTGGGATNAATTLAHFGLKTACVACVGNDPTGKQILGELTKERIGITGIQIDKKRKTGYSVIFLSGSGHRAILTHRGASGHIEPRRIPWRKLETRWIYLTSVGGNMSLLKQIFRHAAKNHIRIAWNPGGQELHEGLDALAPLLKQTDVLMLNREEAALLTERSPRHLTQMIRDLERFPREALVITDGGEGAYVHGRHETLFAPALRAKRINTTGAGDAFGSAFVATFIRSNQQTDETLLRHALQAGMLNATGVITHMGAKTGILKRVPLALVLHRVTVRKPAL